MNSYITKVFSIVLLHLFCSSQAMAQGDGICPDTLNATLLNYSNYEFSIVGIDENAEVEWDFGDGNVLMAGDTVQHAFMAGEYVVTAFFMDQDCPWDGPSMLSTMLNVEACGIEISYVETKTSLFTFTAVGIPEEYPMYWDMGDGTTIVETWVVDNFYDPGVYNICSWYYTELCPDTVEACVELAYAPDTTCSAFFSYELIPSATDPNFFEITELHALNVHPEWTYTWDLGEGPVQGSPDTTMYIGNWNQDGHIVCLYTQFGGCRDTVCRNVMLCDYGSIRFEITAFGVDEEVNGYLVAHYGKLLDDLIPISLNSLDSTYSEEFCLWYPACFELSWNITGLVDSFHVQFYHMQNVVPLLDTIVVPNAAFGFILNYPGCYSSVEETSSLFSVYPTLAHDFVQMQCPTEMSLSIFDLSGRCCSTGVVHPGDKWSVEQLPPGVYLVQLKNRQHTFVTKIVREP